MPNFQTVRKPVQNRNGFDLSHSNSGTATCGTLTPVLSRLLIPKTSVNLKATMRVELPPLATRPFGTITANLECFWVPCRILYQGWKKFISNQVVTMGPANVSQSANVVLPSFYPSSFNEKFTEFFGRGTLADYLGYKSNARVTGFTDPISLMPFLAYGSIYNSWYRNSRIQNELFSDYNATFGVRGFYSYDGESFPISYHLVPIYCLPFVSIGSSENSTLPYLPATFDANFSRAYFDDLAEKVVVDSESDIRIQTFTTYLDFYKYADGVSVFSLRQRNYSKDYFTNAWATPQQTGTSAAKITVGSDGYFTIPEVRAANALQHFDEINGFSGEYDDIMELHFGIKPSDATMNRPIYLGRIKTPVYTNSVVQTGSVNGHPSNPYNCVGSKYGIASASADNETLVKNFTTTEFGYLFCIFSLVPTARYNQGINKQLTFTELGDFAFPELQGVGMEDIKVFELYTPDSDSTPSDSFGYTERYASYKFMNDEVHAELGDGGTLEKFVLARDFVDQPVLSSSFLQINKNDLDAIFATDINISNYSCWYDIYFDFKISQPLSSYSIPTLGEDKDTHMQTVNNGGRML